MMADILALVGAITTATRLTKEMEKSAILACATT